MVDTSSITAALPPQTQQQNPLQVMSTIQGIVNAQQQNKLMQQELINRQIEQQRGELGVTNTKLGMAAGMAWMLKTQPNLTYAQAMQGIDEAERLGYPTHELEAVRGMLRPDMDSKGLSDVFGRVAMQIVGPKVAQEMMTPSTSWRNNGQQDIPLITQPVGNMQGVPAGVPTPAWTDNQGNPKGIQQYPGPQWQTRVGPGGDETSVPSPSLSSTGQPIRFIPLDGGGSGGAPPPSPSAPSTAAPSTAAPSTPSAPAPTVAPAVAPGGGGGFVRTKLSPEQETANKESAAKLQEEFNFDSNYARTNQQNLAALEALRNANTGAGSTQRNWAKSFVLAVNPEIAKRLGFDEDKINWFDEANKYLTARKNALSGPAVSDYARASQEMAQPNVEMSKKAAIKMHQINAAFDNMREAAFRTYMSKQGTQSVSDPNVAAGFMRYWNNYMNTHDYRAYMPQNAPERYQTIRGIPSNTPEAQRYGESLDDAHSIGVEVKP